MKNFLAVYIGSPESTKVKQWEAMDEATRETKAQTGMQAWKEWVMKNHSSLVQMGGPLGETKRVNEKGVVDTNNTMSAFTVVQAESHEAAAKLFTNHPHFAIFPGDSVEIMEVLPIPGQ